MWFIIKFLLLGLFVSAWVIWYAKYDILIDDSTWPYYQCEISIDSSKTECQWAEGIWHMCQIYDHTFDGDYIPNFCYDFCLPRSWTNENCATVSVTESINPEAHERPSAKRLWLYYSIKYDWIFWKSSDNDSNTEEWEDEKINENKTTAQVKKECEFDSDCKDYCDNTKIIDMYCDLSDYKCKQWKKIDCGLETENFEWEDFTKTCNQNLACEISKSLLTEKNEQIGIELKKYNEALTETSKLRQKFQNECEKWVILVSTKLVSDTSILLLTYSTTIVDLIFDTAWKLVEEWLNQITSDPSKMSPDEYVVWACSTRDYLKNQEDLFHKKISNLVNLSKAYRNKTSSLENQ